jgi:Domain of Unknown Function (DUF326)
MAYAKRILDTHPSPAHLDREVLARCIEACVECGQSCTACADANLAEEDVAGLRRCIRLCLDCADVCDATGRVLSRQTEYDAPATKPQLESCRQACATCGEECERHAEHHAHCTICAAQCRRCQDACDQLLALVS